MAMDHPSVEDSMVVDEQSAESADTEKLKLINVAFFNDPHFLAAERTFQDHLYLNWFSEAHIARVKKFQEGVVNGTMAAPWKDQVWERENAVPVVQPSFSLSVSNDGRAGYVILLSLDHASRISLTHHVSHLDQECC